MMWKMKNSGLTYTELADQLQQFVVSEDPIRIPLGLISCLTFIAKGPSRTLKGITQRDRKAEVQENHWVSGDKAMGIDSF